MGSEVPTSLNITDVFWTFQGEGHHWGTRALFVRMPFCNLACSWCDTEFNTFKKWSEEEFKAFAQKEPARFAVLTGGEPMMNKHSPRVVQILKELGFYVATETNGMFPIVEGIDFVTCSPKKDKGFNYEIHPEAYPKVSEFKYVVDEGFDFAVLDRHSKDPANQSHRLSPEYGIKEKSLERIMAYIKEFPRWKINLQTHKQLNVP